MCIDSTGKQFRKRALVVPHDLQIKFTEMGVLEELHTMSGE